MELFKDMYKFISSLTFIDVIFFMAIIALLILIVTLMYFIKINKDVLGEDDLFPLNNNEKPKEDKKKEDKEENNLLDLTPDDEEGELLDLESLTKKLESEKDKEDRLSCNKYEQDQEEKAIISYDELLKHHNKYAINYEKEEVLDDVVVKKVNLNDLTNKNVISEEKEEVKVISYDKEEAFLNALKELNRLLN